MNLQNHLRLEATRLKGRLDAHHGELDNVGSRALNRHVERDAFGGGANRTVARFQIGQGAAATEEGFGATLLAGLFNELRHIPFDRGEVGEDRLNELLCLLARNAKAFGKAKGGDAIEDAKVDHFALGALLRCDLGEGHIEDGGRGLCVDVLTTLEGGNHRFVTTHGRHEAEFHLGVVGREQNPICIARHEGGTDALATFGANRDVLQVGIRGGEAARIGQRLMEGGVDTAINGRDVFGQTVNVGILELDASTPIEEKVNDGMLIALLKEQLFVGGELTACRAFDIGVELEFAKEEFADLFGRGEVDAGACVVADGQFQTEDFALQFVTECAQGCQINANASAFHLEQDVG